jgi:Amt family ammonium transporter
MVEINSGDTAWVLASAALVLFMTPGLAVFYGGMVRAKSVLNMMMMSFAALGVTTIIWVLYGYSLAFGTSQGGLIGSFEHIGLANTINQVVGADGHKIPTLAFSMFQLTFAAITVALLSGVVADRVRFKAWLIFVIVWITLVYIPVAHWVFAAQNGTGGWIVDRLHALDFAGGLVVEINSGASALALALVIGRREGFKQIAMRPHNMPLVLLGAGMLWFGWFGFNAGSALSAGQLAATAMINTQVATAAAAISWMFYEVIKIGRPTTLGIASGAIAGAVVITPACGFVTPLGALLLGLIAGVASAWAVSLKFKWNYDDSLDVVGVHGVSGLIGMLGIGFLATTVVNEAGGNGLFFNGGTQLLTNQVIGIVVIAAFSFTVTWLIATGISKTMGFRASKSDEVEGLDTIYHAESAYDISGNSNRF